jgi:hypothetical protein
LVAVVELVITAVAAALVVVFITRLLSRFLESQRLLLEQVELLEPQVAMVPMVVNRYLVVHPLMAETVVLDPPVERAELQSQAQV